MIEELNALGDRGGRVCVLMHINLAAPGNVRIKIESQMFMDKK